MFGEQTFAQLRTGFRPASLDTDLQTTRMRLSSSCLSGTPKMAPCAMASMRSGPGALSAHFSTCSPRPLRPSDSCQGEEHMALGTGRCAVGDDDEDDDDDDVDGGGGGGGGGGDDDDSFMLLYVHGGEMAY